MLKLKNLSGVCAAGAATLSLFACTKPSSGSESQNTYTQKFEEPTKEIDLSTARYGLLLDETDSLSSHNSSIEMIPLVAFFDTLNDCQKEMSSRQTLQKQSNSAGVYNCVPMRDMKAKVYQAVLVWKMNAGSIDIEQTQFYGKKFESREACEKYKGSVREEILTGTRKLPIDFFHCAAIDSSIWDRANPAAPACENLRQFDAMVNSLKNSPNSTQAQKELANDMASEADEVRKTCHMK